MARAGCVLSKLLCEALDSIVAGHFVLRIILRKRMEIYKSWGAALY